MTKRKLTAQEAFKAAHRKARREYRRTNGETLWVPLKATKGGTRLSFNVATDGHTWAVGDALGRRASWWLDSANWWAGLARTAKTHEDRARRLKEAHACLIATRQALGKAPRGWDAV